MLVRGGMRTVQVIGMPAPNAKVPQADAVVAYIRNQAEHHRHVSYQDEVREFFKRYEVAFNERYVWD